MIRIGLIIMALLSMLAVSAEPRKPVDPELYFGDDLVSHSTLSPDGQLIATRFSDRGRRYIEILNPITEKILQIDAWDNRNALRDIQWLGARSLIFFEITGNAGSGVYRIMTIEDTPDAIRLVTQTRLLRNGYVVDALPGEDDAFLYYLRAGAEGVYKVRLLNGQVDPKAFRSKLRLNKRRPDGRLWLTDHHGQLRFAVARDEDDDQIKLWFRPEGNRTWRLVRTVSDDVSIYPQGFNEDYTEVYVLTDEDRDLVEAMALDLKTGQYTRSLYAHPSSDVNGIIMDVPNRKVLGVLYTDKGKSSRLYFDQTIKRHIDKIGVAVEDDNLLDGLSVHVTDRDLDGAHMLLWAESAQHPGLLFYYRQSDDRLIRYADVAPWLNDQPAGRVHVIKTTTDDGFEIEGYLTLARSEQPTPLIVMAHGGPIGVRDTRYFDKDKQFFAALGFSVLEVNYRGSAGYGKAFKEAGKGEWASGIQNDIQHVLEAALEAYPIDPNRICSMGISYGGYSALISAIQRPEQYQCAASVAGPTDLGLMFSSSDWNAIDEAIAAMTEIVGDPHRDAAYLKEISPLYQVESLQVPVHISHGYHDNRVDVEHYYRMVEVLEVVGKPFESMLMMQSRHGPTSIEDQIRLYRALSRFLSTHLQHPISLTPEPEPESEPVSE